MKLDPDSEEAQKRMAALMDEMQGQTDRGVAIVGAAWVEESLSAALEHVLHAEPEAWKRLFKGNGALTTFSAKIDLARLLGITTEVVRRDLHRLRELRNEFAHQIAHRTEHTKLSFFTPHIKDTCFALKVIAHESHHDPRNAFVHACAILNTDFERIQTLGDKIPDMAQVCAFVEAGNKSAAN